MPQQPSDQHQMPPMERGGAPAQPLVAPSAGAAAGASAPAAQAEPTAAANYSIESERLVIACVLRQGDEVIDAALPFRLIDLLSPEDFFMPQHQAIWTIVSLLLRANLACEPVAVVDHATRQDLFTGGVRYLAELLGDPLHQTASAEAVEQASERIKEMSLKRRLEVSLREALALVQSGQGFTECLSFIEDEAANLRGSANSSRTGPQHQSVFLHALVSKIEDLQDSDRKFEGCRTGFEDVDRVTGGLADETLTVLAGRPGMGKTAAALKIVAAGAEDGRTVLMFSLEMTGLSLARRTVARDGHIDMGRLQTGELEDREFSSLVQSVERLKDQQVYIDDTPGLTMAEIRSRAREFRRKHPRVLIIVDYLQKIAMDKGVSDPTRHTSICSSSLLDLARTLHCPVVALAQLNRDVEKRTNKRPMMSDLRESGQIEQDAQLIMFLYRDEYYNADTPDKGVAEIIIAKNRDGQTCTVKTGFEGRLMDFVPLGTVQTD